MMNKVFPAAQSYYAVCRYVCQDQRRVEILAQEGVRSRDYKLMARDFEMIGELHEGKLKPVFHGILDFYPDEKVNDAMMVEIGRKYLERIGLTHTQYAFAKHIDKAHLHVHIIANRINYNGKFINSYKKEMNSVEMTKSLIREYNLMPMQRKDLQRVNFENLNEVDAKRYRIYQSIMDHLPGCRNLEELEGRLSKLGIETRYRCDEQTGERQGISFRLENRAFSGSKIDQSCSLHRLEKTLAEQQKLTVWEQQKLALQDQQERTILAKEQKELWEKEKAALKQRPEVALTAKKELVDKQKQAQGPQQGKGLENEQEQETSLKHSYRLRLH
jgi:Relaxase/Mobilisation nuclease domain